MHRRAFLTAASVAAGTVTLSGVAPPVGSGDILRLGRQLDTVNALDAQRAGHDRMDRPVTARSSASTDQRRIGRATVLAAFPSVV
ncbi:hypothetical protein ACWGI1_24805 [Streptomyces sp. NPDC054835]|uniref:hypothetical protein n=1 Tax=Streptomyces sp. NBC_01268 TaxID=2903806 RepID=UPI002E34238E|nr:hypothetical protein [Streptomyces sp. NBC_01268]